MPPLHKQSCCCSKALLPDVVAAQHCITELSIQQTVMPHRQDTDGTLNNLQAVTQTEAEAADRHLSQPPKKFSKKFGTISRLIACHPCAGAMLIFSVSFQFFHVSRRTCILGLFETMSSTAKCTAQSLATWQASSDADYSTLERSQ